MTPSTRRSCLGVCDKIVPGLFMGALAFGHLPVDLRARRPDAVGHLQRGEGPRPRPLRRRARSTAQTLLESEMEVLPLARHLHLLRHRQLQPDDDGDERPAPARRRPSSIPNTGLRDALTAAAPKRAVSWPRRRRDTRRWPTSSTRSPSSTCIVGPAGHRRVDQPRHPSGRHGAGGGRPDRLDRHGRAVAGDAAAGPGLSERLGGRERLPGRRAAWPSSPANCSTPAISTRT